MRKTWIAGLVGAWVFALAATASAQFQNHLACFKIKDSVAKAAYTITTQDQFFTGTFWNGCVLKTPAKTYCQVQTKVTVTPTPPGGGPAGPMLDVSSGPMQGFFCYKVKCPKNIANVFSTKDQFGTRSIAPTVTAPKLYCAPASPSGAFLDDDLLF